MDQEKWRERLLTNEELFIGEKTAFRSAVLIPLVQLKGEWCVLFEVRSSKMRTQPGDICFPGGRIDPTDESPLFAALRETHEELGVNPDSVEVLAPLSPYITSPSFVVYPFVGIIDYEKIIRFYNKNEVEEVFIVPLQYLLEHEPYMHEVQVDLSPCINFPYDKIRNGANYQWRTRSVEEWFFEYENYTIWGMTARILKQFIDSIRK
ncbi:CoA pyrophosphatase [Sporosarcina thermotolerans]|uniref:CoA pyrophosphatase n=1 Tax=Sporosarcina thermotolerans TaxID=633404 RepID=A0AAW9ABC6_9BACL|nr:CoA pyrophosphatase [Sporosarcina thermotolerans]MDW0117690.1 CoA pyrophosphatase [Sporosarcina thermotolerans]